MKKFIALCIFAIGIMVMLPPPSTASHSGVGSGSNAPPGHVSFVIDQQFVAPAAMLQDYYCIGKIEKGNYEPELTCRKGGGVEVRKLVSVTQPNYLTNEKPKLPDFSLYNNDCRLYLSDNRIKGRSIQKNNVSVYRVTIRADTSIG